MQSSVPAAHGGLDGDPDRGVDAMELALGTETRSEYYGFEVIKATRKIVEEIFPIQPGESVVITADTGSDARVVQATAQSVYAVGAHPVVIWLERQPEPCLEPPAPVAQAVKAANAWIDYAVAYLLYSPCHREATANGTRYLCYTGMDVDMLIRTVGKQDWGLLTKFRDVIAELSTAATEMRITSPAGTNLVARVNKEGNFYRRPRQPGQGYSQMLGGQSGFGAIPDTINGTLVFDGAVWPPDELGALRSPISLTIVNGDIKEVSGGREAKVYERWLAGFDNPMQYRVAHISYGFNPGVTKITGRIVEDERVFGCVEVGIGPVAQGAKVHSDGVVLNASLYADGTPLEEEGVYVHPRLVEICREMGVAGY
jgi:leucyl aminopeptidase (aminopeptidase T)